MINGDIEQSDLSEPADPEAGADRGDFDEVPAIPGVRVARSKAQEKFGDVKDTKSLDEFEPDESESGVAARGLMVETGQNLIGYAEDTRPL